MSTIQGTEEAAVITVYTAPGCHICRQTMRKLTEAGIKFETVDISTNPAAREYVTEELGAGQVPVIVDDTDPAAGWSGPDPIRLARLIEAHREG